jgi:hypothetical protein
MKSSSLESTSYASLSLRINNILLVLKFCSRYWVFSSFCMFTITCLSSLGVCRCRFVRAALPDESVTATSAWRKNKTKAWKNHFGQLLGITHQYEPTGTAIILVMILNVVVMWLLCNYKLIFSQSLSLFPPNSKLYIAIDCGDKVKVIPVTRRRGS